MRLRASHYETIFSGLSYQVRKFGLSHRSINCDSYWKEQQLLTDVFVSTLEGRLSMI